MSAADCADLLAAVSCETKNRTQFIEIIRFEKLLRITFVSLSPISEMIAVHCEKFQSSTIFGTQIM